MASVVFVCFSYLYPDGRPANPDLSSLVSEEPESHIQVTEEQYELYCEMNTTFELCKICAENNKEVRIEPCGHLLCSPCLVSWQVSNAAACLCIVHICECVCLFVRACAVSSSTLPLWFDLCIVCDEQESDGVSCPFCRTEIKGTESVKIDPFDPSSQASARGNHHASINITSSHMDQEDDDNSDHPSSEVSHHQQLSVMCLYLQSASVIFSLLLFVSNGHFSDK